MSDTDEKPVLGNMQPTEQGLTFVLATLMKKHGWTAEEARHRIAEAARRAGQHYTEEGNNGNEQ